jgi:hypothetical protein
MHQKGIAGSIAAEEDGIFLARDPGEVDWFVRMGRSHHSLLDVWEAALEEDVEVEEPGAKLPCRIVHGFFCWMQPIPPWRLRLIAQDL